MKTTPFYVNKTILQHPLRNGDPKIYLSMGKKNATYMIAKTYQDLKLKNPECSMHSLTNQVFNTIGTKDDITMKYLNENRSSGSSPRETTAQNNSQSPTNKQTQSPTLSPTHQRRDSVQSVKYFDLNDNKDISRSRSDLRLANLMNFEFRQPSDIPIYPCPDKVRAKVFKDQQLKDFLKSSLSDGTIDKLYDICQARELGENLQKIKNDGHIMVSEVLKAAANIKGIDETYLSQALMKERNSVSQAFGVKEIWLRDSFNRTVKVNEHGQPIIRRNGHSLLGTLKSMGDAPDSPTLSRNVGGDKSFDIIAKLRVHSSLADIKEETGPDEVKITGNTDNKSKSKNSMVFNRLNKDARKVVRRKMNISLQLDGILQPKTSLAKSVSQKEVSSNQHLTTYSRVHTAAGSSSLSPNARENRQYFKTESTANLDRTNTSTHSVTGSHRPSLSNNFYSPKSGQSYIGSPSNATNGLPGTPRGSKGGNTANISVALNTNASSPKISIDLGQPPLIGRKVRPVSTASVEQYLASPKFSHSPSASSIIGKPIIMSTEQFSPTFSRKATTTTSAWSAEVNFNSKMNEDMRELLLKTDEELKNAATEARKLKRKINTGHRVMTKAFNKMDKVLQTGPENDSNDEDFKKYIAKQEFKRKLVTQIINTLVNKTDVLDALNRKQALEKGPKKLEDIVALANEKLGNKAPEKTANKLKRLATLAREKTQKFN